MVILQGSIWAQISLPVIAQDELMSTTLGSALPTPFQNVESFPQCHVWEVWLGHFSLRQSCSVVCPADIADTQCQCSRDVVCCPLHLDLYHPSLLTHQMFIEGQD
jgi:hypothetical protein